MTFQNDGEIIVDSLAALGAAPSNALVATAQDIGNIVQSIGVNVWNNFAEKEEWEKAFNIENFWSKAYNKSGGIKDILLDFEKEMFTETFSVKKINEIKEESFKSSNEIELIQKVISLSNLQSPRVTSINSALSEVYEAGPLLFSNMFDVAFVLKNKGTGKVGVSGQKNTIIFLKNPIDENQVYDTKVRNSLFSTSDFSVRCASISIPQPRQDSFTTKFLSGTIERASSTVTFDNSATLTVDMDANLYYLDFFQSLAGLRPNLSRKITKTTFANNNMSPNLLGNKDYQLDLVVTSRNLGSFHIGKYNPTTEAGDWANICFVFQDVRFVGASSGVKFDKNSENFFSCGIEFIFKNIYTIYKNNQKLVKATSKELSKLIFNQRLNITDNGLSTYGIVDSFVGTDIFRKS